MNQTPDSDHDSRDERDDGLDRALSELDRVLSAEDVEWTCQRPRTRGLRR